MKIYLKTILVFILFTVINSTVFAQFGGGDGLSEETAYKIYTVKHLEELSDSVNSTNGYPNWSYGKYFKVMNDITDGLKKTIGISRDNGNYKMFQGYFDGQNYIISLAIDSSMNASLNVCLGLFARIAAGAVIKNVQVNGYIKGSNRESLSGEGGGGIAGQILLSSGNHFITISNCINMVNITAQVAGGIFGGIIINGIPDFCVITVENCINIGTIEGHLTVGGIFGQAHSSTITNSMNYGLVIGKNTIGGIAGYITNTTISNCFNSGVVIGNENIGCIVGRDGGTGTVTNCHYDKQMCGE